jgi:cytidylate kinase
MKGGSMKANPRSITAIVEEQVQKWQLMHKEKKEAAPLPVITISREPGSGGRLIAKAIAEELGMDLFHQEVLHEMAKSAQVSSQLLETLDEKGLNTLEHWVSSMINARHLWPDEYSQHLMKVIGTIAKHGSAVLVGRGANFILPREKRFSVRIVAPQAMRIANVAKTFDLSQEDATRRVIRTNSDRKAFVHKYFNADIADPLNYDMVLNTEVLSIAQAARAVSCIFKR